MDSVKKAEEWLASTCAAMQDGHRIDIDPMDDRDTDTGHACDCLESLAALLTSTRADERAKVEAEIMVHHRAWGSGDKGVVAEELADAIEHGEHRT